MIMGKSRAARRKAALSRKSSGEQRSGEAVQPVDSRTASHDGGSDGPVMDGDTTELVSGRHTDKTMPD